MNPPPKKHILNLPKWGGGIPLPKATPLSFTPSSLPTTRGTNSFANQTTANAFEHNFELIQLEIKQQREYNASFYARILPGNYYAEDRLQD
jgi:hypothetical protein